MRDGPSEVARTFGRQWALKALISTNIGALCNIQFIAMSAFGRQTNYVTAAVRTRFLSLFSARLKELVLRHASCLTAVMMLLLILA